MVIEGRKGVITKDTKRKCVSSNYFSKECEEETTKYIEEGYWVCFCANCIGHTRAKIFEINGESFLVKKYGEENLRAAKSDWGDTYYRLWKKGE